MHDNPFFRDLNDKIWHELETQVRMARNGGIRTVKSAAANGNPQ